MSESVQGEYIKHSTDRGFIYAYICPRCGKRFLDTAPELSAPSLCNSCYFGKGEAVVHRANKPTRKPTHKQPGESV